MPEGLSADAASLPMVPLEGDSRPAVGNCGHNLPQRPLVPESKLLPALSMGQNGLSTNEAVHSWGSPEFGSRKLLSPLKTSLGDCHLNKRTARCPKQASNVVRVQGFQGLRGID